MPLFLVRFLKSYGLACLLIIGSGLAHDHHHSMYRAPISKHSWRQADAYSMALNYYQEGHNLFQPAMHFQDSHQGKSAGEFPLMYYLNAKIWLITGEAYWVPRLLNYSILLIGLLLLFHLTRELTNNQLFSFGLLCTLLLSPLVGYYSNSFLVNLNSLSFLFMGWYCYVKSGVHKLPGIFNNKEESNIKLLYFFGGLFFVSLSGLLRSTMLIGFLPILAYHFFGLFTKTGHAKKYSLFLLLLLPIVISGAWVLYIKHYNELNNSSYFLTKSMPIWGDFDLAKVWADFVKHTITEFYPLPITILLLLLLILCIYFAFRIHWKIGMSFLAMVLGGLSYFLLWFRNFDYHDYYLIEFLLFIPPIFWILYTVYPRNAGTFVRRSTIVVMILLLTLYLLPFSLTKTRMKYRTGDAGLWPIYIPAEEYKLWEFYEWKYKTFHEAYLNLRPKIRQYGFKRTDLVLSMGDPTPNFTLSLIDCKGYTDLSLENTPIDEKLDRVIEKGVKLVLTNSDDHRQAIAHRKDLKLIFEHKNIAGHKVMR